MAMWRRARPPVPPERSPANVQFRSKLVAWQPGAERALDALAPALLPSRSASPSRDGRGGRLSMAMGVAPQSPLDTRYSVLGTWYSVLATQWLPRCACSFPHGAKLFSYLSLGHGFTPAAVTLERSKPCQMIELLPLRPMAIPWPTACLFHDMPDAPHLE